MTDDLLEESTFRIPEGFIQMNWVRGFGRQMGPLYECTFDGGGYTRAFYVAGHHTNGMGNAHGGMLMAFADVVFGHCVSMRHRARYWVTVRMLTDFISAARRGDWVEGTAGIVGEDGDLVSVRGRIWVGERTVMTGTGVFKLLGQRPARR